MNDTLLDTFDIPVGLCLIHGELYCSTTRPKGRRFVARGAKNVVLFDTLDCFDIGNASATLSAWVEEFRAQNGVSKAMKIGDRVKLIGPIDNLFGRITATEIVHEAGVDSFDIYFVTPDPETKEAFEAQARMDTGLDPATAYANGLGWPLLDTEIEVVP